MSGGFRFVSSTPPPRPQGPAPVVLRQLPNPNFIVERHHPIFNSFNNATVEQRFSIGDILEMRTPHDVSILIWQPENVANMPQALQTPVDLHYFCHGWSLQTYDPVAQTGYTIMSSHVHHVLKDPDLATQIVAESKDPIKATTTNFRVNSLTFAQASAPKPRLWSTDLSYRDDWSIQRDDIVT